MTMKRALQVILAVGVVGLLFSGVLSYRELIAAPAEPICTPVGQPGTILGYPPCVYGLAMYFVIVVTASLGLRGRKGSHGESARIAAQRSTVSP